MINRSLWLLLWLLSGFVWPTFARGATEQVAPSDCKPNDRPCKLNEQGFAQYGLRQYEAALASFREAYTLHPDPSLLFNIGRTYQSLGKSDEALAAYRAFLQQSQGTDEAFALDREKARIAVEKLEHERAARAATPNLETPPHLERKPIYKKWWFWTIIGGAAAAVAVGTAIGVSAQKPDLSDVPRFQLFPPSNQ